MNSCFLRCLTAGLLYAAGLLFAGPVAMAHGGHDERVKLRLTDKGLTFDTHLPAKLLSGFDANRDGKLTAGEFRQASDDIRIWIADRIKLEAEAGTELTPVFYDTPVSEGDLTHAEGEINFVRVLQHYEHDNADSLAIKVTLFEDEPKLVLFAKEGKIYRKTFPAGPIHLVLK